MTADEVTNGVSAPDLIDLVRELRETLGLFAGAMPCSPQEAWNEALAAVSGLKEGRCWKCEERSAGHGWDDALREEMEVVAAGLDLLVQGGCDQAKNLIRLRDHLRKAASPDV